MQSGVRVSPKLMKLLAVIKTAPCPWIWPWTWAWPWHDQVAMCSGAWYGKVHPPVPRVRTYKPCICMQQPHLKVGVGLWIHYVWNHQLRGRGRDSGRKLRLSCRRRSTSLHIHQADFRSRLLLALRNVCHNTHALWSGRALEPMTFLSKCRFRCHICLRHLNFWVEHRCKECCMFAYCISMAAFTRTRERNLSPRRVSSKVMESLIHIDRDSGLVRTRRLVRIARIHVP